MRFALVMVVGLLALAPGARAEVVDARPGGCFCEKMPNGGVRHMTVTHVMAPGTLVLNGGLGPLGTMATTGVMELTFKAQG